LSFFKGGVAVFKVKLTTKNTPGISDSSNKASSQLKHEIALTLKKPQTILSLVITSLLPYTPSTQLNQIGFNLGITCGNIIQIYFIF